ncbi:galactosyl transferase GMA12/MNN10 family protein [Chaetomium strumarium]|uniref:Galactosyl transferase GMA12/MNN10 family protein n=1 Tax=Chaetomium strumarium TaxID=1170767 RepID=A0AAJ0M5N1_9PEZI|nr:galactosyl transferase GMA12/MNN10 family protein [Chaetomium strumarium]
MLSRTAVLKALLTATPILIILHQDNIHCYGKPDCFPAKRHPSLFDVKHNKDFCLKHGATLRDPPPRLAMVTAQLGIPEKHYQRALRTHALHNAVHGTGIHILCTKIVDDLWNKPAFILDLLLREMEKPESDRLEWLFWVDRDTIILDTCRSPLSFLPPREKEFNNHTEQPKDGKPEIHMLATKDWNGLNNGVFLVQVNRWSVDLFFAILAFRYYRPDVELTWSEQSAMGFLLEEPQFRDNVAWVPQWWLNPYPPGDFLVHFAGVGGLEQARQAMKPWLDVAETAVDGWAAEPRERDLNKEIRDFWEGREST